MAGRGRGKTTSLTQEQLQVLGCMGKDMPSVPTAPPPTFPALLSKPVSLDNSTSRNYQLLWKEDFSNYMRDSPYFLVSKSSKQSTQSYSEQYISILEQSKEKQAAEIPWNLMPIELRANSKRKKLNNKSARKKKKLETVENVEEHLKKLEEKEKSEVITENKDESGDSDDEENEEINEIEDDEMDEENDYGNNYFDNGEAFNEEDDNLDDGPVY